MATTHGMTDTPTWNTWHCMVRRCTDAFRSDAEWYWGKGIKVCARWDPAVSGKKAFPRFFKDMGERPEGCTLGRLNSDGNYSPKNCKWQTWVEQNPPKLIEVDGVAKSRGEWAEHLGIEPKSLSQRVYRGWGLDAYRVPLGGKRPGS